MLQDGVTSCCFLNFSNHYVLVVNKALIWDWVAFLLFKQERITVDQGRLALDFCWFERSVVFIEILETSFEFWLFNDHFCNRYIAATVHIVLVSLSWPIFWVDNKIIKYHFHPYPKLLYSISLQPKVAFDRSVCCMLSSPDIKFVLQKVTCTCN